MRKFRYYLKLIAAFLRHFKFLILGSIALGVVLFFAVSFINKNFLQVSKERIGIAGKFTVESLPNEILDLTSSGLTDFDSEGVVVPSLATSWETPDEGKTWIFKLNPQKQWHDNTKVVSSDIHYELIDVEIERPDDETIIFKLKEPYTPFPSVLNSPVFKKGFIGVGDWEVTDVEISSGNVTKLQLTYGDDTKIFNFYPTEKELITAYKLGEVDLMERVYNTNTLADWKTTRVEKVIEKNKIVTIFFNTEDKWLSDKSLRQALTYAIDKESMGEQRALSPIPRYSWAYNPKVKPYEKDSERSEQLIDDITGENTLSITLQTSPTLLSKAEQIISQWKEVGVDATVQVTSTVPRDYQAYLTILDVPIDPDQYPLWHSTQTATNISNYSNPRIDKLLEDGRIVIDLEERRKTYLDFQRFLMEDVPAAFLIYNEVHKIKRL